MKNYYKDKINEIADLIDQEKFQEAKLLVEEELTQPYIPKEYEGAFTSLFKEINLCLSADNAPVKTIQTIVNGLFSHNPTVKLESIMSLSEIEINSKDLDFINIFLKNEHDNTLKTLLFQILIDKNIDFEFDFKNGISIFSLNPIHTKELGEFYQKKRISKIIYNLTFKEPSLHIMCESLLDRVLLKQFPKLLPDSPAEFAQHIVNYCRSKLHDEENFPREHFKFLDSIIEDNFYEIKN